MFPVALDQALRASVRHLAFVSSREPDRNLSPSSRIVLTAVLYFLLVFIVGLALGPVRVIWLEPLLGRTMAVLCETPCLLAAMALAARRAPLWTRMGGAWPSYLAIGVLALIFQQIADLAVGFGLRGMTLTEQISLFATPPGFIYAFNLLAFAFAPLVARLIGARRSNRRAG